MSTNVRYRGCVQVKFSASGDAEPLKTLNWITFVASFFNKERQAAEYYHAVEEQYNCAMEFAEAVAQEHESNGSPRPVVAFVAKDWGGNFILYATAYKQAYVTHAGTC